MSLTARRIRHADEGRGGAAATLPGPSEDPRGPGRRTGLPAGGIAAVAVLAGLLAAGWPLTASAQGDRREARLRMVQEQIASARLARRAVTDDAVLRAMRTVPRHEFVPEEAAAHAYEDRPLPIGHGQTISQPYIVAFMTKMLRPGPEDTVFELGTGSGYQAAVLSEIVDRVYSVEIVAPLAESARGRLGRLGFANVTVRHGDGYYGWEEHAPFDAIVVTAAASHIPPPLIEQLAPGGRMVIPVGSPLRVQTLMLVEKREDGSVVKRNLMPVRFVPLRREGS